MVDHLPAHAAFGAFQPAAALALEPGAAHIAQQAGCGRRVEQDEPGRALQALRQAARVVAVDHPG
ncbi:hypothetical protein CATMIT_01902, partial [Catenibacterium mitsuokai DSM 15897]